MNKTTIATRKAFALGSVLGATAIVGSLVALGSVASAQDEPAEQVTAVVDGEHAEIGMPADDAAWEAFDTCLADNGVDIEPELTALNGVDGELEDAMFLDTSVFVQDGEEMSFATFGDGDGSITITKSGDDVVVTTTGDASVETDDLWEEIDSGQVDTDWEEIDADLERAFEACEGELPDDALSGFVMDLDDDMVESPAGS